MGRTLVLLTAFGPFPSRPFNASMPLVSELAKAARRAFPDVEVVTDILATEWHAAPMRVSQLHDTHAPDIALHFGVSSRARGFEIEARGRNTCSETADAAGLKPSGSVLSPGGPDWLATNLPATRIVTRLRQRGIPAFVSWDAGSYLCNALLYHALVLARQRRDVRRNGFIHIPHDLPTPNQRRSAHPKSSPLTFEQALVGGLEIIATCLHREVIRSRRLPLRRYAERPTQP